MDEWLDQARGRIAAEVSEDPSSFPLDRARSDAILELARIAAHESGERTNAPLVCYLVGLAIGRSGAEPEAVIDAAARRMAPPE